MDKQKYPMTKMVVIGGLCITIGTFVLMGKVNKQCDTNNGNTYLVYALLSAVFAALTAIIAKLALNRLIRI